MSDDASAVIDLVFEKNLFDPIWYRNNFPDVRATRLDPAHHYRRYGYYLGHAPNPDFLENPHELEALAGGPAKDPFRLEALALPTPAAEDVLADAHALACEGKYDLSVRFAELHVPQEIAYTIEIIRANAAIARGDTQGWLAGLNAYLAHYKAEPVVLKGDSANLIDRLSTRDLPPVEGGPMVSVIMPAWNAEATVEMAVRSILNQSWRNLELIVVDDNSSDGTWGVLQRLACLEPRLRIRRNAVNAGPYVSKNLGLDMAQGEWITGHDADDWAHPGRIENHLKEALSGPRPMRASVTFMIRIQTSGFFDTIVKINPFAPDGVTRVSSISALFERKLLRENLGYWDSVRFGADSEMIARTQKFIGDEFREIPQIGMICLSTEQGLTNHPEFGIRSNGGRPSPMRLAYKKSWTTKHSVLPPDKLYLPFPQLRRSYEGSFTHAVPLKDIQTLIDQAPADQA